MTSPENGEPGETHDARPEVRQASRRAERGERTEARRAARQAKADERSAERSSKRSAARASGRASSQSAAKDPFVEAPRAPKASGAQRRRAVRQIVAGILGAVGLLCSVVLALGALLLALGISENSGGFETISSLCDTLIGPLRDLFSFSGTDADKKETLAAWGAGSIGYLVVSLIMQRYLPPRSDDA